MNAGEFEKVLGIEYLTSTVQKFEPTDGLGVCRREIFTRQQTINGTVAKWDELSRFRYGVPYVAPGSSATKIDLTPKAKRTATMAHVFFKRTLDREYFNLLREVGTESALMEVQAEVNKELADMRRMLDYTIEHLFWAVLTGSATITQLTDGQNPITFTVTHGVTTEDSPAQIWTSPGGSYNIISEYLNTVIPDKYNDATGFMPSRAWCNNTVFKLWMQNPQFKAWYKATNNAMLQNLSTIDVGSIRWNKYDFGQVVSGASTVTKFIANNRAIVLPEGNPMQATLIEGRNWIPDPNRKDRLVRVGPGPYSYGKVEDDPPGITLFMGYDWLPVLKWPEPVMYYHVH
jgi:hypothetical protein